MKIYAHKKFKVQSLCVVSHKEPKYMAEHFGWWPAPCFFSPEIEYAQGPAYICTSVLEKIIGEKMPPFPTLVEIEISGKVLEHWEPVELDSEPTGEKER